MAKVRLQVEIQKILNVISKDIYDSPYALLRENVQNAYDAILMRMQKESTFEPKIEIILNDSKIIIKDNGIGMDSNTIENNYWKAGSSGKNNDEARKAGVVGTFGIGAMANFGICSHLEVKSRAYETDTTYASRAIKETLSVNDDCISIERSEDGLADYGTEVCATLESGQKLTEEGAKNYLLPYVKYLRFPVSLNGKIISQNSYINIPTTDNIIAVTRNISTNEIKFQLNIYISNFANGQIRVLANDIFIRGQQIIGDIFLEQNANAIFGLRNNFGLAAIPINSIFNLGGIVNLSFLLPTAGREALSRESINYVSSIVSSIEKNIAEEISKYDIADSNRNFLMYIYNMGRYDLVNKIKIQRQPNDDRVSLDKIMKQIDGKDVYYYTGSDPQIIAQYANENSYLLLLSNENPRRSIQQQILSSKRIEPISDNPRVLKEHTYDELSSAESALIFRIASILKEDYLIQEPKVCFAEISHNVPNMVEQKNNTVCIYLSRNSGNIQQVLRVYQQEFRLFDGFAKDFIRNYLYQKIAPFVPSSTKQGADALFKILQKNKELYTIEYDEFGEIENLMKEYIAGKISINEVFKVSAKNRTLQTQTVNHNQIGTVESEIPLVTHSITNNNGSNGENIEVNKFLPIPPIKILSNETSCKILKTNAGYPQLNNFTFFLGLSDKLFNRERDFFFEPHTTKVIWGMHKIVYIFTHASNSITLYYDIELNERLDEDMTGGVAIPSTTIITKNRLFVPIVPEMIPYFDIKQGSKEFYVRYDIISQLEKNGK
jgi:molecular chaperone HtpG